ncbi:competence protein ComK [Sutcliffiella horikoshii]|uniref:competence protein ComK n=1 Tax=Sutcliffiella horikoshii TaxID=79883 RepID=UPI00384EC765
MEIVNEYLINQRTIAIQPHLHPQYQTKIIDMEGIYYTSERPAEILARSCVKYGATFDGRRDVAMKLTNFIQKTPLLVAEVYKIIALPTHSPEHKDCAWIMFHQIMEVIHTKQSICRLKFHNHTEIEFPVSSQTIRQQIQKAAVIYSIFCTELKISYSFIITDGKKRTVR